MRVAIKDLAYYLPKQIVSNEDLLTENPNWNMNLVRLRAGVEQRHIARKNETALDLSFKACKKLFAKNKDVIGQIDGLIFCTQSPDHLMPPNACILHKMLDLPENVFAFDFNLGCSGYVYGLALAQGLIRAGTTKDIFFVTADTYSKYIHDKDRSARVLFSDGAAVSWITVSESTQGIIDLLCSTAGKDYKKFMIPAGACRIPTSPETKLPKVDNNENVRTLENIHMDGMGILAFVNSKVPKQILKLLDQNNLSINEISLFIFHQASKMTLDSLTQILKIPPEKVYNNMHEVGNTVSASIPISLKMALDRGIINTGEKVLLSGFGVGLSWGSAIIEI